MAVIAKLSAIMGPKPIFIADGHHRYETACNYREQIYDSGFLSPEHPANYTLMMCVAMDDPGLIVMPTHRLFRGSAGTDDAVDCPQHWPATALAAKLPASPPGRPAKGPRRPPRFGKTSRPAATRGRSGCTPRRTAAG